MKIYVCHSTSFDFKKDLYGPIKDSSVLDKFDFIFPHEKKEFMNTKKIIKECDAILGEVSYPSTGMGIELGWANTMKKRILLIHKENITPSLSLGVITDKIISYNQDNLDQKIFENLCLSNSRGASNGT